MIGSGLRVSIGMRRPCPCWCFFGRVVSTASRKGNDGAVARMLFEYNVVGRGGGADGHTNAIMVVGSTSESSCGVCGAYLMGLVIRYMLLLLLLSLLLVFMLLLLDAVFM